MEIKPLATHYSFENPASVYDEEAMTALKLAGRQAAKINEVVNAQNTLEKETDAHLTAQDNRLEKQENELIPQSVDNAIQDNIQRGTFDKSIDAYMGNLSTRVDNLLEIPAGGTTMDAEVVDARLDIYGKAHKNAGSAIRAQVNQAIFESKRGYYYNRLNPDTVHHGIYLDPPNGTEYENTEYYTSDYIPVSVGERFAVVNRAGELITFRFVTFYNSAKEVMGDAGIIRMGETFEVPDGAAYMQVTLWYVYGNPEDTCIIEMAYRNFIHYGKLRSKPDELNPNYIMNNAYYYNRIVKDYCIQGYYPSNDDGTLMVNPAYACSNYIGVLPGETLVIVKSDMTQKIVRMVAAYDEDENFLPELSGEFLSMYTNTSKDKVYIRLALETDAFLNNEIMVCEIGTPIFLGPGMAIPKSTTPQIDGMIGGNALTVKAPSLGVGHALKLDKFPAFVRKNLGIVFKGEFTTFTAVEFGHGGLDTYASTWFKIDPTTITINSMYSEHASSTVNHGLTISRFIVCSLTYEGNTCHLDIITDGGRFTHVLDAVDNCGTIFAKVNQNTSNASLSATCADFAKPLWLVGDSYFGISNIRVIGQLENLGFSNYLLMGQPGLSSGGAYNDLLKAFNYGTPKTLVWYLGMNDGAGEEPFASYLEALEKTCKNKGINLIVNKVPTVPTIDKSAIHSVIQAKALRYIDSHGAVGASSTGWSAGLLSSDGVHPTELGATILAAQMLVDVPEIMAYGRDE